MRSTIGHLAGLIDAGDGFRLDNAEMGAVALKHVRQIADHTACHCTDARLYENMGGCKALLCHLLAGFVGHCGIA